MISIGIIFNVIHSQGGRRTTRLVVEVFYQVVCSCDSAIVTVEMERHGFIIRLTLLFSGRIEQGRRACNKGRLVYAITCCQLVLKPPHAVGHLLGWVLI